MNWNLSSSQEGLIANSKRVAIITHIRNNETKEVVRIPNTDLLMDTEENVSSFWWEEGNGSCDCNRELLFERAKGKERKNPECSEGRYSVNLENPASGTLYYKEF